MVQQIDFDKYKKNGAYHYDWYDDPNWAWYKECVDRCVDFCEGSTIDVGGGDGLVASKIIERGHACLVLDKDHSGQTICEGNGIPFMLADVESHLTDPQAKFDYLVCLNTIEHLGKPGGIVELLRDFVSKGAIIITDKATEHKGRYHEHEYTKEELLEVFKEFNPHYFEINSTEFGKPITFIGVEIHK